MPRSTSCPTGQSRYLGAESHLASLVWLAFKGLAKDQLKISCTHHARRLYLYMRLVDIFERHLCLAWLFVNNSKFSAREFIEWIRDHLD